MRTEHIYTAQTLRVGTASPGHMPAAKYTSAERIPIHHNQGEARRMSLLRASPGDAQITRRQLPGRVVVGTGQPPACAAIAAGREKQRCSLGKCRQQGDSHVRMRPAQQGGRRSQPARQVRSRRIATLPAHLRPQRERLPAAAKPTSMQKDRSSGRLSASACGCR